jgi:hypothetical protein
VEKIKPLASLAITNGMNISALFKIKEKPEQKYRFQWYDIGKGNPFNKKILDCRDYTQNNRATTRDSRIAERFNLLRQSNGKEYVSQGFEKKMAIKTNLKYPPTDAPLTDLLVKSTSFDEKWDIYVYDNRIYFTRSWTGELVYKAFATVNTENVTIYKVELQDNDSVDKSMAISNVHFLVTTQLLNGIIPHRVPTNLKTDMEIAHYSFSQFGNGCWYATHDDILDTVIKNQRK